MPDKPEVSVLIVSYNSGETIRRCLRSVLEQQTGREFEIIVVDSSTDGTGELVEREFPEVKVHRFSERKYAGGARNIGISVAEADIVAFIDADCLAAPDWLENIAKAHELPHLAIGGAIGNAEPQSMVGWAAYFCEFNKWMPGTPPQWMGDVAGASMTYKKQVIEQCGRFIEGCYCSDTDFHWRLSRDGVQVWFEPSIQVFHIGIGSLTSLLEHEFHHGRSFARIRLRGQGFSSFRRLVYVLLWPLVLCKLLARVTLRSIRTRAYLPQFLRSAPLTAVTLLSWTLGETVGYLDGS